MPQRQRQRVLLAGIPDQIEFTATDGVFDARIIIIVPIMRQTLPQSGVHQPAVFKLGTRHQINPVPAAREWQTLAVGLMYQARSGIAQTPAAGQGPRQRVHVDQLRLMVRGTERAGIAAIENLPVEFLRVTKP